MSLAVLLMLALFVGLLFAIYLFSQKSKTLSRTVLFGLVLGSAFGLALQFLFAEQPQVINHVLSWVAVVGKGYVGLLKMVIMPLVLVFMIAAVVKLENQGSLGKISFVSISILLVTTALAALVGIAVTYGFNLSVEGLVAGTREAAQMTTLESKAANVANLNVPQMLLSFIPENPFADLSNTRSTSIIAVVIFGVLIGIAARKVMLERSELTAPIRTGVNALQATVMSLVKMVIALTPYGVAGLMANVVANSSGNDILNLLAFIIASYVAILLMFVVHGILLSLVGVSPKHYFTKIWPVMTFAFSSRSSAASIPMNIDTQVNQLKVPPAIANLSASFGATIGQNGCAGIYPAMLAMMVAPSVGIDPMTFEFILPLIGIVVISSFGIAGVGGGATFAALVVLPTMGLPIEIVALLISIEPLIDMARTALNVSGSITSGVITSKIMKTPQ
ncbi:MULTISPECIES: cation:dicarboxylase symporter family transporter [Pseudoalteromonas]|nr:MULTISPECIES: cation:dicarboxylase symporter family transporter [unclassified Pseudoalteromonas]MBH0070446.1 cation:dicarboxylase symporter family transporter [Pseudoalteromonas sp. NZS127]PCC13586.1 L-cystine transporter [Pseudoalteromonas sp. JB197]SJN46804.1 L-cystine uptake protein TcyP [Pseudoalteromonas sp. JB197]|tara:strand:+ start:21805 stop:23148 length:1344 start_codon:yes stop_codon:yes gene_type:complete